MEDYLFQVVRQGLNSTLKTVDRDDNDGGSDGCGLFFFPIFI